MKFILVIVLVIVLINVLVLVIVHEFYSICSHTTVVLVTCHSIIINLEMKDNHEKYASETMLKHFLVTSYLVVSQLKYRSFILVYIFFKKLKV